MSVDAVIRHVTKWCLEKNYPLTFDLLKKNIFKQKLVHAKFYLIDSTTSTHASKVQQKLQALKTLKLFNVIRGVKCHWRHVLTRTKINERQNVCQHVRKRRLNTSRKKNCVSTYRDCLLAADN